MLIDDVQRELLILMERHPPEETRLMEKIYHPKRAADNHLARVLGCLDYQKSTASRTFDPEKAVHPAYASLGAKQDFHDEIIVYAYDVCLFRPKSPHCGQDLTSCI